LTEFQELLDDLQAFLVTALFIGSVVKFRSVLLHAEHEKVLKANAELAWQDKLLRAVNGMAVDLLTSEKTDLAEILRDNLRAMARCVDVDRAYIWRNETRNGKLCYIQVFEWLDSEKRRGLTVQNLTGFSYVETFPFWEERFAK
jgi:hypothetical protein